MHQSSGSSRILTDLGKNDATKASMTGVPTISVIATLSPRRLDQGLQLRGREPRAQQDMFSHWGLLELGEHVWPIAGLVHIAQTLPKILFSIRSVLVPIAFSRRSQVYK